MGDCREEGQLLVFATPQLDRFEHVGKKAANQISLKVHNQCSLIGLDELKWTELFWPRLFPERQLAVPVQAAHWETDSRLPVKDCAWRSSYEQIQGAP